MQDSQKAQIAGATISAIRAETGDVHETKSDNSGFFSFPVLIPGKYDIKVEKDGFGTQVQSGVQLLTGQTTPVEFQISPGQVEQSIEVQTDAALLQTATSSVTNVIENKTITNFPLVDRRATQLQRLNGFVIGGGTGSGAYFAIAGGRGGNANYTVDGGTTQNLLQGVPTQQFDLPIDSLQEFSLSVSDYTAELGRSGGGIIQMTTKSGTNHYHGSAYIYYRSQNLQAVPLFTTKNPPLKYKLFGGSIGGPIKKDKTFFFFTYEGKLQTSTSVLSLSVPSAAERTGDFSAIAAPIIDPYTGKQVIGDDGTPNKLPAAELDPYGVKLASYYPLPNVAGAAINSNNFTANNPAPATFNDYVVRIDHTFGQRDSIYGRFLAQPDHTDTQDVYSTPGTDQYGVLAHNYYYNPSATWNHIFNAKILNEARVTFTRRQALSISHGVKSAAARDLALPGTNPDFFPGVTVNGLSAIGNTSQQQRLQTPIVSNEYTDNFSWQRGNHQFKFGADYRTASDGDLYSPSGGGFFTFNNLGLSGASPAAAVPVAAGSLANLLWGRVNQASRQETLYLHSLAWSLGLYAQDNWHVNDRLTLNYGLRWDVDSPRYLSDNRQNSFNTTQINPVSNTPGVITFAGINGQSKYANNFDDALFGPRFGFAYTPREHSVIRGGFSVLYPGEYDQATPIVLNTGFSNAVTVTSSNPGKGTPAFLLKNNATAGTGLAAVPTLDQLTPGYGAVAAGKTPYVAPQFIAPHRLTGYLYQANFNVQHEFAGNVLLEIGYLGTFGHHLPSPSAESINQITPEKLELLKANNSLNAQSLRPFPQFSNVQNLYPDIGASKYNGVNIGLQKRYSHGFQYQVNYTYSKFLDNQTSRSELAGYPGTNTYTDYYNPQNRWGLSGNDVRNRLLVNGVFELPFGRGKLVDVQSQWLNKTVGGWSVSGLAEIHSGTALSVIDATNNTGSFSDGVRPNLTGDPNSLSSSRPRAQKITQWFNTGAFTQNAAYTFGNAPRTFGRGPSLITADFTLLKRVALHDDHGIEFRVEAFNAFNHANLGNPNTTFGNANFGKISTLQSGTTPSRTLQLAAHYTF